MNPKRLGRVSEISLKLSANPPRTRTVLYRQNNLIMTNGLQTYLFIRHAM